jgi:hypothetical protein
MGQGCVLSSCLCLVVCPPALLLSRKSMITLVLCVFGRVEVEGEMVSLCGFRAEGRCGIGEGNAT